MLVAAVVTLGAALLAGTVLAVLHLRGADRVPRPLVLLHLALALCGLGLAVLAGTEPVRSTGRGTAAFGTIAAAMIAIAALVGIGLFLAGQRGHRLSGALIGVHAMMAVGGFVILVAYLLAG